MVIAVLLPVLPVSPSDLIDAPQLAALAVLASALHATRMALFAVHIELLADEPPLLGRSPDKATRLAERLLRDTDNTAATLRQYEIAVRQVIRCDEPDSTDDPF